MTRRKAGLKEKNIIKWNKKHAEIKIPTARKKGFAAKLTLEMLYRITVVPSDHPPPPRGETHRRQHDR